MAQVEDEEDIIEAGDGRSGLHVTYHPTSVGSADKEGYLTKET